LDNDINKKIFNAMKWSTITEIIAKLIAPITNMVVARFLAPEAFGIVATVTMITSFADMLTDAGFQKYLVQHEFKDIDEKNKHITVAFWTNLGISLFLCVLISVLCKPIAILVGNPGLGMVIVVACISLPLTALSSIQMALYRRDFNYKALFYVRFVGICIPFVVTIPLVLIGFSYWALIIGTICGNLSNAIILTVKSKWKPIRFFRISILKEMLSFSMWSLVEAISIWLTSWIDIFIVGSKLNVHYLGIYTISMNTVNAVMALITGATTSVLFAALSRLQNDDVEYKKVFFKFQQIVGLFVFPMGVGIYMYRDLITSIMLGSQWGEASLFIGLWGLMSAFTIVFCNYSSVAYISQGKPKLSVLAQVLHLIILIPTILMSTKYSFTVLVYARSLIRFQFIIVQFVIMYFVMKISPWKMVKNVLPSILCAVAMSGVVYLLEKIGRGVLWELVSIVICAVFYFAFIMLFPSWRKELLHFIRQKTGHLKRLK